MKRKTSSAPTRVYRFGCLQPTAGLEVVEEQLRRAHRYRNAHVEYERERRARKKALDESLDAVAPKVAVVARLDAEVEALDKDIRKARSAKVGLDDLRLRKKALVEKLKKARAERKEALSSQRDAMKLASEARDALRAKMAPEKPKAAELREAVVAAVEKKYPTLLTWLKERFAIDDEHRAKVKALRQSENAPFWGTYLLLDEAADQAAKALDDPKFKPYTGEGLLGVQLQGGMTVPELFSETDTRLRVKPPPADTWTMRRGDRLVNSRTTVHFRVGSTDTRAPVWAVLPLILHRPLPADGVIKWARLHRFKDGPSSALMKDGTRKSLWKWELHLVLEAQSLTAEQRTKGDTIAIDLGWRRSDGGVRLEAQLLGTGKDSKGQETRIYVPKGIEERLAYADSLRSTHELNMNAMRDFLLAWRNENKDALPAWLVEELETLHLWRGAIRFFRLRGRWQRETATAPIEAAAKPLDWMPPWRQSAVKDDKLVLGERLSTYPKEMTIFDWLTEWQRQHEHLWRWESRQRRKALLFRREEYRKIAKQLALKYRRIVMEAFDLRTVAEYVAPEVGPRSTDEASRKGRRNAAPAEFRNAVKAAAAKFGAEYMEVDAKDTSKICPSCAHVNEWTDEERIKSAKQCCQKCKATFDFDVSAADHLLKRAG